MELDNTLFNINIAGGSPTVGSLLVSEPFLKEQWFRHSVICLVDYSEGDSAMGVVMNRPSGQSLQSLIDGVTTHEEIPVWIGGPMSLDRLFFIHTLGELIPNSREISPGLYIGGDFDEMLEYVNGGLQTEGCIRFFVGYSGWSPGQLDQELRDHVWAVGQSDTPRDLLTGGDDSYWHRYVKRLGEAFRNWLYHPINPQLN